MTYLLCKHKVADYDRWREVFDGHAAAQRESGLRLLNVLRDAEDPNTLVLFFKLEDVEKANAFMEAPSAEQAARESGVIGEPEVWIFNE